MEDGLEGVLESEGSMEEGDMTGSCFTCFTFLKTPFSIKFPLKYFLNHIQSRREDLNLFGGFLTNPPLPQVHLLKMVWFLQHSLC